MSINIKFAVTTEDAKRQIGIKLDAIHCFIACSLMFFLTG